MNYNVIRLLLAICTMWMTGCAAYDKSMASDAVDIPNEPPLSAQPSVFATPTPSPSPAHNPNGQ